MERIMTPREVLYSSSSLKSLPLDLLQEMWTAGTVVELGNGASVFKEGDRSDGSFYMVAAGELSVLIPRPDGSTETRPKVRGDLCGESALVNKNHSRTASVTVTSSSAVLLRWDGKELLDRPSLQPLEKLLSTIAWVNTRETEDLKQF